MLGAALLAWLVYSGRIRVWEILAVSFIGSCMLALDNPTRQSLVPDLVPRRDLLNAVSINSAAWNGAALVGPALAGALLPVLGAAMLFFLNALSFLAVLIALALFRGVPAYAPGHNYPLGQSILAGLRFALRSGLVLGLLLISTVVSLFGRSYTQLLPIFARDIYRQGPEGYGLLLTAGGLGALIGAFGMASLRGIHREGAVLVVAGLIAAGTLAAFAVTASFWAALLLLVAVGVATTVVGTIIATLLQLQAPGEMRGRVMSLYAITLIGIPALGALGAAAVATALGGPAGGAGGAPRAILMAAVVMAACVLLVAPRLWPLHGMTGRAEVGRPADEGQSGAREAGEARGTQAEAQGREI
jgi:MFS family permease